MNDQRILEELARREAESIASWRAAEQRARASVVEVWCSLCADPATTSFDVRVNGVVEHRSYCTAHEAYPQPTEEEERLAIEAEKIDYAADLLAASHAKHPDETEAEARYAWGDR